ncbi:MAG: ATP12 family protein, partial [Gemmobacter sp.]
MSEWTPRRFWSAAAAVPQAGGFAVCLDGRPVRTPARAALILPTAALAEAIAGEWDAQGPEVRPATMPLTRAANSAIDKVIPQRAAVADEVAGYGACDLICYRAEAPAALAARQASAWDPLVEFARETFGAPLNVTCGVMPAAQPGPSLERL